MSNEGIVMSERDQELFEKLWHPICPQLDSINSSHAYKLFQALLEHCKQGEPICSLCNGAGQLQMTNAGPDSEFSECHECDGTGKSNIQPLFAHAMPKSDPQPTTDISELNELAARQEVWLKSMGWWKDKTHLESLMLIVSECGEAANEVRGLQPTDKFQTELADIILRTLGLAAENGIDIQQAVLNKMAKNLELKPNPDRLK